MITPRFSCTQTDTSVAISVYCPSVRASEVEINVDDTLVTVHINPYFLRLNFPGRVLEDDASAAQYDPSSGTLTVTLTKETSGQEFKDLDLLAKLLAPRPSTTEPTGPAIEVIASEETGYAAGDELSARVEDLSLDDERREILEAAANDWQMPQTLPKTTTGSQLHTSIQKRYGFLDMHSGYFTHVSHSENEVNELGADVETCPPVERRRRRTEHEDEKWDEDYYMANFAEEEEIQELVRWTHPHLSSSPETFQYTEMENATMLRLPRKEYLPTAEQTHWLYHTLVTLLFSYAYDARTTQHEPTPESAWTIGTLTPAFSALDPPPYPPAPVPNPALPRHELFAGPDLAATLAPSFRRVLAFPLYRSFALAQACRADVAAVLRRGKRTVVRCLLEMKEILDHHDVYYVYAKIWVDDFLVWVMAHGSDDMLGDLGQAVEEANVEKSMMGWDLESLEDLVRSMQREERQPDSDDE